MNRELGMQVSTLINRRPHFIYGGRGSSVAISKIYYEIDDFMRIEVVDCEVYDDQYTFSMLIGDNRVATTVSSPGTTLKEALTALFDLTKQYFNNRNTNIQNTHNFLHRN